MLSRRETASRPDFVFWNSPLFKRYSSFKLFTNLRIFEFSLEWRASVGSIYVAAVRWRILFVSSNRSTLVGLSTISGKERDNRFPSDVCEVRRWLKWTVASIASSSLRVRRCIPNLELASTVKCTIFFNPTHSVISIRLVYLLNHHHWAFLLATCSTAHHDHIGAILYHLKMLRHALTDSKYHICLLLLLDIWRVFAMNLLNIDHLVLRSLNVNKLMVRAHLDWSEWSRGLHSTIKYLVSRRCILLLSRRGPIIIIRIIHSHG